MSLDPSESLQRLIDEEPFVRMLARSLLADEADDVVQQTWLHVVRDGGRSVNEPRSWLARIVHNVAHNLRRGRRRRERHEPDSGRGTPIVPSPAEMLEREDARRQLVAVVNELPDHLRTVVLLRYFDQLPPRRIAAQLGLPVTTVWNQLRRALQLLRERLDAEHDGQRRAWLLPLVPFAAGTPGSSGAPSIATQLPKAEPAKGVMMPMKATLTTAAAVLLAGIGGMTLWVASGCTTPPESAADAQSSVPEAAGTLPDAAASSPGVQRTPVWTATSADAPAGVLVVHVRHGDDKTAALGVTMLVMPVDGDLRVDALRQKTDGGGEARFEGLPAGSFRVVSDRCDHGERVEIDGSKATVLDYELPVGLTLTGIVVDRTGAPVASALLDLAPVSGGSVDAATVAMSGEDGRFVLRSAPTQVFLGARAAGHASSPMEFVTASPSSTVELRLQLGAPAGTVSGVVVDAEGNAVPRAILRIGTGRTAGLGRATGEPPVPATVHTDDNGSFVAVGIAPGTQPVVARAARKAPWRGSCEVTANTTTSLRLQLGDGATIRGTVRDAAGAAVAGATVAVGNMDDLAYYRCSTSKNGEYELTGLMAGEVQVVARREKVGRASQATLTIEGNVSRCDLQLSGGLRLQGRVIDETGAPVANAILMLVAAGETKWMQGAASAPDGRFAVSNCPPNTKLSVTVRAIGIEQLTRRDIDPTAGPIELRVHHAAAATVKIRGRVVDSEGKPLANVWAFARNGEESPDPARSALTGTDGSFELGPLAEGAWSVLVRSMLYPPYENGPRDLNADAVWDLEQVKLVKGGTVRVRGSGDLSEVLFVVVSAEGRVAGSFSSQGPTPAVSNPLAPGSYKLCVLGKNAAADAAAFTVRAGEEANVALELRPGVRQRVELTAAALASPPNSVTLRIHRGLDLVTVATCSFRNSKQAAKELCLVPGDYRVAVFDGARELAAAEFSVPPTTSAAVQIELR